MKPKGNLQGYVYVLTNNGMPGLIKIGRTTSNPSQRASDLSSTGVPYPFKVVFKMKVTDCEAAERWLHNKFSSYRVNHKREFFKIPPNLVIEALREKVSPGSIAKEKAEKQAEIQNKKYEALKTEYYETRAVPLTQKQDSIPNPYLSKWICYPTIVLGVTLIFNSEGYSVAMWAGAILLLIFGSIAYEAGVFDKKQEEVSNRRREESKRKNDELWNEAKRYADRKLKCT